LVLDQRRAARRAIGGKQHDQCVEDRKDGQNWGCDTPHTALRSKVHAHGTFPRILKESTRPAASKP
jgi:hypothetical protein